MAESNTESGSSWWGSWLQTAKDKSASALEMVKKDLAEYTCTMQQDTSKMVAISMQKMAEKAEQEKKNSPESEKQSTAEKVKKGFSSFLEGISQALTIPAEDLDTNATSVSQTKIDPVFDRAKARLHALQIDPETYYKEPSGSKEEFENWLKSFVIEDKKGEISELLVSKVEVRAFYTKLVPSEMSHAKFWQRYFYRVHRLQLDEARKIALMKRAERAERKEDSIGWEEDWSGDEDENKTKGHTKEKRSSRKSSPETESLQDRLQSTETPVESCPPPDQKCEVQGTDNVSNSNDKSNDNESNINKTEIDSRDTQIKSNPEKIQEAQTSQNQENDLTVTTVEKDNNEVKEASVSETISETIVTDEPVNKEGLDKATEEPEVVVNPDRVTPISDSSEKKDTISTDDDWERDFDVELTEEDMKEADEIAKKLNLSAVDYTKLAGEVEEDWESWDTA